LQFCPKFQHPPIADVKLLTGSHFEIHQKSSKSMNSSWLCSVNKIPEGGDVPKIIWLVVWNMQAFYFDFMTFHSGMSEG
jgi:hypothetical protein